MNRIEQKIQQGVFSNLIPLMHLQKYSQFVAFQIRNETGIGGSKGAVLGKIAKSMGTMDGVSDVQILFPAREEQVVKSADRDEIDTRFFLAETVKIPPKSVFIEFKALKPLKTKERKPESLLSPSQKAFKGHVEGLGFEYHICAAESVQDALCAVYSILRDNGVTV